MQIGVNRMYNVMIIAVGHRSLVSVYWNKNDVIEANIVNVIKSPNEAAIGVATLSGFTFR